MHVNITTTLTESYPELRNTFSQANAAYGKGKVSTKYISAVINFFEQMPPRNYSLWIYIWYSPSIFRKL